MEVAGSELPEVPFLFVSGSLGEGTALEALRHGAADFVPKQNLARLGSSVRRALNLAAERARRRRAEEALEQREQQLREAATDRERLSRQLQATLAQLESVIPFCAGCQKIRDDRGVWNHVKSCVQNGSLAALGHSLCPECAQRLCASTG